MQAICLAGWGKWASVGGNDIKLASIHNPIIAIPSRILPMQSLEKDTLNTQVLYDYWWL